MSCQGISIKTKNVSIMVDAKRKSQGITKLSGIHPLMILIVLNNNPLNESIQTAASTKPTEYDYYHTILTQEKKKFFPEGHTDLK